MNTEEKQQIENAETENNSEPKNDREVVFKGLVLYPNSFLRINTKEVTEFNDELRRYVEDMCYVLQKIGGVGLAAPQVGWDARVFVCNYGDEFFAFINPEIVSHSEETNESVEACLSIPGISPKITRYNEITYKAKTVEGDDVSASLDGYSARIFQHELDHLYGLLIVDKMKPTDRVKFKKVLKSLKKMHKAKKKEMAK